MEIWAWMLTCFLLFYSYEYYPLASGFLIQKKGILTSALYSYSNNDSNGSRLHFPVDKENAKEGTIPFHWVYWPESTRSGCGCDDSAQPTDQQWRARQMDGVQPAVIFNITLQVLTANLVDPSRRLQTSKTVTAVSLEIPRQNTSVLASFMSTWCRLESSEKKEPQLRKCLNKMQLKGVFLISD